MIKNHIAYNPFSDWKFTFQKAKDSYIWDDKGNKYIDFTSGWNVTNLGWNHSEVNEAIISQAEKNVYAPMWTADVIQEEYAETLLQHMPEGMNVIGRATGGTEANEMAIKIARAATGRKKIIGFKETYHGQLFAVMALGYSASDTETFAPLVPQFIQLDYPESTNNDEKDKQKLQTFISHLEDILKHKDVAAIVCEPEMITGWGSCKVAVKGFTKSVREMNKKYGTLLILDEVGTGFSRIGRLFGYQYSNINPDIITLAKGISNGGAAIGAVVTSTAILEPTNSQTNLVSTFGWTPIACAAALKTLQVHIRDKTWEMSQSKGEVIKKVLNAELKKTELLKDVRGLGLEIGVEFTETVAEKIITEAFKRGLHLTNGGSNLIQLMPPVTIEKKVLDEGLSIFIGVIKSIKN